MSYRVRPGDSLSRIAAQHKVSLAALIRANPKIRNPNAILPGQTVNIPGRRDEYSAQKKKPVELNPATRKTTKDHRVRSGESLWVIGRRNRVSVQAMIRANPQLRNPNDLRVGQVVHVPIQGTSKAAPAKKKSGPGQATGLRALPQPVRNYTRVKFRGVTLDKYTRALLLRAETISRKIGGPSRFSLQQGSYSRGVSASAGTHDGGGALDILVGGMSSAQRARAERALRMAGFAAWRRGPPLFGPHLHAVAIGNAKASSAAKNQVRSYLLGRNGLANNGRDPAPSRPIPNWVWRYVPKNSATYNRLKKLAA